MAGHLTRASMVALWLMAGCASVGVDDAMEAGGVEGWGCGDYFDGCGFRGCPVTLTADFREGSGTVTFAGTVNTTTFAVVGLVRRWDWCAQADGTWGCAFVIDTDGDGKYYDFTRVMPDPDGRARTTPAELFKCTRRRIRDG